MKGLPNIVSNNIKKSDACLIGSLLLIAGTLFLISHFTGVKGERVKVTIDGATYHTYSLNENREVTLGDLPARQLTFRIENGFVFVTHSSCSDLICVKHRKICKTGESIICLPNRVVIAITGNDPGAPDSITR